MATSKPVFEIDGAGISSLEDFYDEVSTNVIPGAHWGRNLDAFNDILRGGFGTPDEGGFVLRWTNSRRSKEALGPTLFDDLVRIIRKHGAGGSESEDLVELELA